AFVPERVVVFGVGSVSPAMFCGLNSTGAIAEAAGILLNGGWFGVGVMVTLPSTASVAAAGGAGRSVTCPPLIAVVVGLIKSFRFRTVGPGVAFAATWNVNWARWTSAPWAMFGGFATDQD